ncbi:MAG: aminoglycoside phosphotransferase family protein [Oscillospiraceae bacterium]|nr:aminoglycoside phosphotransferase family protein [Oscillospiraceae bacterium]
MNMKEKVDYAGSLGEISGEQFEKALQKLNLGNLIKVEKVTGGVVGQNVFLTSTKGEYVFRGRPFYDEQFDVEKFAVENLREKTSVPTAYPYMIDNDTDIFGFKYAIMPRMSGIQTMNGGTLILDLSKDERLKIARAMAETLAEMHKLKYEPENHQNGTNPFPFAFEYKSSEAYAESIIGGIANEIEDLIEIRSSDVKYINEIIAKNKDALSVPFEPCFLMDDFKEDNVLFSNDNGEWKVCAVFDFAMSHFGDCERDLSRISAMYIDEDASLAKEFINTYIKLNPPREKFFERLKLYMLNERKGIWWWAKTQNRDLWDKNMSLTEWLEPYLNVDF